MSSVKFNAELTDFKIVYNVLKAVSFKEFAIFNPMQQGLKVTIDDMKCAETSVYIPSKIFSSYHVEDDDVKFKISLKVFTECLCLFEDDIYRSLKLVYRAIASPLYLLIKHSEENCTVDCQIETIETDNITELSLSDECNLNKIVIDAASLLDILTVLDNTSDELQISITKNSPFFRLKSTGSMGDSTVDISKESEVMTIFQCTQETKFHYAFQNIRQILKVMQFASNISISTCESGLLGLQLVINTSEKQMYVEYYVTSLFEDQ